MAWEQQAAAFAAQYPLLSPLVAYLAPFISGEAGTLILAFLAGQGIVPLPVVIIGTFLGMLTLDAFWFMAPRSRWGERVKKYARSSENYRALEARIESLAHHNDIVVLFISKVMVGTRILVLAYLSVRTITIRRFLMYDTVATLLWAIILGYIGYYAGIGYYSLAAAEHQLFVGALYTVGVLALFYAVLWFIRKWITKT
jgi:membrane protein DedA with SNARE-associated domain